MQNTNGCQPVCATLQKDFMMGTSIGIFALAVHECQIIGTISKRRTEACQEKCPRDIVPLARQQVPQRSF